MACMLLPYCLPRNVCQQLNIIKMADVSDNRFNVLRENDDVEDLDDSVSQAITTAVLAVVEDSKTVKGTPKTNGKTRATTGNKIDGATIGDIVSQVVLAIQPVLIKAVTSAVTTATRQLMTDMATKTAGRKAELYWLKKEVQLHTFELNRLEQYSRRESIRICGIDETAGEDTDDVVRELAADIGVTLKPEDISVSHTLPGRPRSTRPIIVKFVRRNSKKSKRKLRDTNRKGVYINDDLTPLRAKVARILRNNPSTQSVWSIDGRIFCTMLENGSEVKKIVDSPDDLFRFGWSEEVKNLNIYF